MENLDYLGKHSSSLLMSLVLAILGFILYWGIMISKKKNQKADQFELSFWWRNNWLAMVLSFIACTLVFTASYVSDMLTLDRSIMIGSLGAFLVERLQKIIE